MQAVLAPRVPAPSSAADALDIRERAQHPGGRRELLTSLYRQYAPRVLRWIVRFGGPEVDAEDTLHEVFCVVFDELHRFEGRGQITTWLFAITRNVVWDRLTRDTHRRRLLGRHSAEMTQHYVPFEHLEQRHSMQVIHRVLADMPEKYRTVFVLLELDGLSAEEASELTGIKSATLRVQRMRARTMFMSRFDAWEKERGRTPQMAPLSQGVAR